MDFRFYQSNSVDASRRPFALPLASAFHSYHEQQPPPLSCSTSSSQETHNQTDDFDEDDNQCSHDTKHSVEVYHTVDDSDRADRHTPCGIAAGDHGGPANQLMSRNYSVAELLRNDQPSSSAVNDNLQAGQLDSGHRGEEKTPPIDSAFRGWNVKRPAAPLLPPFFTSNRHLWTDWMMSDNWLRPHLNNEAQRRCFGVFDAPPVNFIPMYMHSRRGTELQLPLSTFGRHYSVPRATDYCRLTGRPNVAIGVKLCFLDVSSGESQIGLTPN